MPYACCYIDDILIDSTGDIKVGLIRNYYVDIRGVMKRMEENPLVAQMS